MDTLNTDGTWDRLASITQLLHHAATQVWSAADQAAPDSPLHDLGLGVYLAHSHASALLPAEYDLPDMDADELELLLGDGLEVYDMVEMLDYIAEGQGRLDVAV